MTQHLVVTAVGADRPGIVNQLTQLVSGCGCNIVDSRVALFGAEFTLIMLISGSRAAMLQIETKLPVRAQQLDLLTVLKPTSRHHVIDYSQTGMIRITIADKPGVISQFTQFISDHGFDLMSLKSNLFERNGCEMLHAEFEFYSPQKIDASLQSEFHTLCQQLQTTEQQLDIQMQL